MSNKTINGESKQSRTLTTLNDAVIIIEASPAKTRWAGYATSASDGQTASSLAAQKLKMQPLWQESDDVLVAFLTDVVRPSTRERPGLERLMAIERNRGCDAVAIDCVPGLSLNVGERLQMFDDMQQYGVEMHDARYGKLDLMRVYIPGLAAQLARDGIARTQTANTRPQT